MLVSYTFNSSYYPPQGMSSQIPGLRLLEGGKFSPGDYAPVIIKQEGTPRLKYFQWNWIDSHGSRKRMHCIPSSRVLDHAAYYQAIRQQRCLIPSDGYYVSLPEGGLYKVIIKDSENFCFAGMYSTHCDENGKLQQNFSLLTTQATPALSAFSLLMPMILRKQDERLWLNPHTSIAFISKLLYAPSIHSIEIYPVEELLESTMNPFPKQLAA